MVFILFALFALAFGDNNCYLCSNEAITLNATNPKYEFHSQEMASKQSCQLNFSIPDGYLASVYFEGSNLQYMDTFQVFSEWTAAKSFQNIQVTGDKEKPYSRGFLDIFWPPNNFQVNLYTIDNTSAIMTVIIQIEPYSVPMQANQQKNTTVNEQPVFMQLMDWQGNNSIQFTSAQNQVTVGISLPELSDYTDFVNFFVYDVDDQGVLNFRGTLFGLLINGQKNFFNSLNKSLVIVRTRQGPSTGTVVVNDLANAQNVDPNSRIDWTPYNNPAIDYSQKMLITASPGQIGYLTILNQADGENAIYFTGVQFFEPREGEASAVPIKLLAGGMVKDYDNSPNYLGTYGDDGVGLPQFLPGFARTFILEQGSVAVMFTTVPQYANTMAALNGRSGFIMTDNYPFNSLNQDSDYFSLQSLNNDPFTFEYSINQQNPNQDAYLNITLWGETGDETNHIVDLNTVATPSIVNYTAMEMTLSIYGGQTASTGTKIPYKIYSTADLPSTTTHTVTPSTINPPFSSQKSTVSTPSSTITTQRSSTASTLSSTITTQSTIKTSSSTVTQTAAYSISTVSQSAVTQAQKLSSSTITSTVIPSTSNVLSTLSQSTISQVSSTPIPYSSSSTEPTMTPSSAALTGIFTSTVFLILLKL